MGARGTAVAFLHSVVVQLAVLVLGLGTGILTARLLGPEGRGLFAALTTWPQLLAAIAISGFWSALVVQLRQAGDPEVRRAVGGNAVLLCFATTTLLVLAGLAALPFALYQYGADAILLARLLLAGTYAVSFTVVFRQTFAGLGAFGISNLCNLLPQLLYLLALLFLAVATTAFSAELAAASLFATNLLALALMGPAFLRLARPSLSRESRARLPGFASFVSRAAGHDLVAAVGGSLDRMVLIAFIPAAELGLYVVAMSFSRLLTVIQPAIGTVVLSNMAGKQPAEMKLLHDRAFRFALLGLLLIMVPLLMVDRTLLSLAYGQEFAAATPVFRVLMVEAAATCLVAVTTQLYMSVGRPGFVSINYGVAFGVLLLALLILVPACGALGAAWATLIGTASRLALLLLGLPTRLKMSLPRPWPGRADLHYLRSRLGA